MSQSCFKFEEKAYLMEQYQKTDFDNICIAKMCVLQHWNGFKNPRSSTASTSKMKMGINSVS